MCCFCFFCVVRMNQAAQPPHANRLIFGTFACRDNRIRARALAHTHTLRLSTWRSVDSFIDGFDRERCIRPGRSHLLHEYVEYELFSGHSFECVNWSMSMPLPTRDVFKFVLTLVRVLLRNHSILIRIPALSQRSPSETFHVYFASIHSSGGRSSVNIRTHFAICVHVNGLLHDWQNCSIGTDI